MSSALNIVRASYSAILEIAEQKDARLLFEDWAQARNETISVRLNEIASRQSGWSALDPRDLAVSLSHRAWARRARRLETLGVPTELQSKVLSVQKPSFDDPGGSRLISLVGPFGAGKTEAAESWHLDRIADLETTPGSPIPLWLPARTLGRGLDRAVAEYLGNNALNDAGAAVVIDGLDEIDPGAADGLISEARAFLAGSPASKVLITSRPSAVQLSDALTVHPLTEDAVSALIELIGGLRHYGYTWPNELNESVKRPFFALALATAQRAGQLPRNSTALISFAIERAFSDATSSSVIGSAELSRNMINLAIEETIGDKRLYQSPYVRQSLLLTRLVQEAPDGIIEFGLPIFRQWFAAQGLLEQPSLLNQYLVNEESFGRWRWSIAVAASVAPTDVFDRIMSAASQLNPGVLGWLLHELQESASNSDTLNLPSRFFSAMRAWVDCLGLVASPCFGIAPESLNSFKLGVSETHHGVRWSISTDQVQADTLTDLPIEAPVSSWPTVHGNSIRGEAGDVWTILRGRIETATTSLLRSEANLAGIPGCWLEEYRYSLCRRLTDEGHGVRHLPLSVALLGRTVDRLLALGGATDDVAYQLGTGKKRLVTGQELLELKRWLGELATDYVYRPAPGPDLPIEEWGGWVWSGYSRDQLLKTVTWIYENALAAYDQLADGLFRKFSWTLGRRSYGQLGLIGTLGLGENGAPVLIYDELPLELLKNIALRQPGLVFDAGSRVAIRWWQPDDPDIAAPFLYGTYQQELADWMDRNSTHRVFSSISSVSTEVDVAGNRPASFVAASWMNSDLRRLGLAQGNFQRYDF